MTKVTLNTSFVPYLKPDEKKEIARQIYNDLQREGYKYKEIAEMFGLSESGLYQALSGKITLSDERLSKILHLASDETLRQLLEKLIIPSLAHALEEAKESLSAVEEAESQINDMIKSLVESLENLGFKASATKSERETVLAISINDVTYTISESDNQLVFSINANNKNVLTITQTKKDNGVFIDYDDKKNVKVDRALTLEELVRIISKYKDDYKSVMNEVKKFYGIAGEFTEKEVVAEINEKQGIHDYIVTKDYQLIDTAELVKGVAHGTEKTTITVNGVQYTVRVEANDEDNYKIRKVFVPESAVLAIVRVQKAGKGLDVKIVYGEGSIETKEEEVVEQAPGKFSAKREYKRWYYVYENHKILIAQQELSVEKIMNPGAKVDINVELKGNILYLKGDDTYYVRDKIKALGFAWSPQDQYWFKKVKNREEAEQLLDKISEFANISFTYRLNVMQLMKQIQDLILNINNKEAYAIPTSYLITVLDALGDMRSAGVADSDEIKIGGWYYERITLKNDEKKKIYLINVQDSIARYLLVILRDDSGKIEEYLNSLATLSATEAAQKLESYLKENYKYQQFRFNIARPFLLITQLENEVDAEGDTYDIRDILKKQGFRYDTGSTWKLKVSSAEEANQKIKNLIEEVKKKNYDVMWFKQTGKKLVEVFSDLSFRGTPLVETAKTNVLQSPLQNMPNKSYFVTEIGSKLDKMIGREIQSEGWTEKQFIHYTAHPRAGDVLVYISPDERYFVIYDMWRYHVAYVIRDDDHDILNFMQALDNFIMKEIPAQLNAKEVRNDLSMTYILYEGVPEDKIKELESEAPGLENALIFKFRYNDFEADVDVWVTGVGPVVSKDEIEEIIRDYIRKNYKEIEVKS